MFKAAFLRWWLFFTLVVISSVFSWKLGFIDEIRANDSTPISMTILIVFAVMSIWCGLKTWKASKLEEEGVDKDEISKVTRKQEIGWFVSDQFLTMGFIGTIWGIKEMVPELGGIDMADVASKQAFLLKLLSGMGIALYTTLVGLVCCALLKIQYFNLSQTVDSLNEDEEETL